MIIHILNINNKYQRWILTVQFWSLVFGTNTGLIYSDYPYYCCFCPSRGPKHRCNQLYIRKYFGLSDNLSPAEEKTLERCKLTISYVNLHLPANRQIHQAQMLQNDVTPNNRTWSSFPLLQVAPPRLLLGLDPPGTWTSLAASPAAGEALVASSVLRVCSQCVVFVVVSRSSSSSFE